MKEQRRRDGIHQRGEERARPAQPATHHPDKRHHRHAEQRDQDARAPVVDAEQEVHDGVEDELQRTVHHRLVLITAAVEELPRVDRVQALIVGHRAVAQADRPAEQRDDQQQAPEDFFDIQPQQASQRTVKKAWRFGFSVFHGDSRLRDK